jgi:hypothetical membrane protein
MTQKRRQSVDSGLWSHSTHQLLAAAGIGGPVVFWVVVGMLGVLTPEYSAVSDYISTLGAVGAPYAIVQQVNFVMFGGSVIALAVGLDRWSHEGGRPWVGLVLVGVFGAGVIGAGVFPDNPLHPDSLTARIHQLVSSVAFVAALVGMPLASREFERSERWPAYPFRFTSTALAVVLFVSLAVFRVGLYRWWAGVAQRQFLLLLTGWIVIHAVRLYHLTDDNRE